MRTTTLPTPQHCPLPTAVARPLLIALMAMALLSATGFAQQGSGAQDGDDTRKSELKEPVPKVLGILFYADWCASCKVLEPNPEPVMKRFDDQPIVVTRFDMTDDTTKYKSRLLANLLGFGDEFQENERKTGFMLLIDPKTKQLLGRLTKTHSEEELAREIERSLGR